MLFDEDVGYYVIKEISILWDGILSSNLSMWSTEITSGKKRLGLPTVLLVGQIEMPYGVVSPDYEGLQFVRECYTGRLVDLTSRVLAISGPICPITDCLMLCTQLLEVS